MFRRTEYRSPCHRQPSTRLQVYASDLRTEPRVSEINRGEISSIIADRRRNGPGGTDAGAPSLTRRDSGAAKRIRESQGRGIGSAESGAAGSGGVHRAPRAGRGGRASASFSCVSFQRPASGRIGPRGDSEGAQARGREFAPRMTDGFVGEAPGQQSVRKNIRTIGGKDK